MRINRHQLCMEWAVAAAKRSTCLRSQVGTVIAMDGRPLSVGYNGAPPGLPHCTPQTCNETTPCVGTIHAEQNAIDWAARKGVALEGAIMYSTFSPCWDCAKSIIAAGLKMVIFLDQYRLVDPIGLLIRGKVAAGHLLNNGQVRLYEHHHFQGAVLSELYAKP